MIPLHQSDTIKTTCPYCGVGCGVELQRAPAKNQIRVTGDPDHPANFGRLCSKGSALDETIGPEERLLSPFINKHPDSWHNALSLVAKRFAETIEKYGPDSVALYVSGQLLTEDYYVANKFMKGFIGSANIDTNSRLCMASTVAGHRRAFGADVVPASYEDLEQAQTIVLVGSNLAWCHPVLFQRIQSIRAERPSVRLVVIDPRRTITADAADLYLPIHADGDAALFNGLLAYLADNGLLNQHYIAQYTTGFPQALDAAKTTDIQGLCEQTGLSLNTLSEFFKIWASHERVVTVFSQGVNQSSLGTDKVNAIINCHLATGRIGKPGSAPFSVTGQPNAMGGREVGGLANMLAAHLDLASSKDQQLLKGFWASPTIATKPGAKAVDLFDGILEDRIRVVWIMATNPADSLPAANRVQEALAHCPFVVVSDITANTDTARFANVLLPSAAWAEKSGTVTNSERRISRQRPLLRPPGEARADWWQITQVANRMGFDAAFHYRHEADIFDEHARLSGFQNNGDRAFDISGYAGLTHDQYNALEPFQWPAPQVPPSHHDPRRFFANGGFYTPTGRANFVAISSVRPERLCQSRPLTMNTGRIRDQWHTMTRTARSAKLSAHRAEPFCEMHPVDAGMRGIEDAQLVNIESTLGVVTMRVLITDRQQPGTVFTPMHWTDQFSSTGRINTLIPPLTDPISGQPASKHVPVSVSLLRARSYGYLLACTQPVVTDAAYWASARVSQGWQTEFAYEEALTDPEAWVSQALSGLEPSDVVTYQDAKSGVWRSAWFEQEALIAIALIDRQPVTASRAWLRTQLGCAHLPLQHRYRLVAGQPGADQPDPGPTVCACYCVGAGQIEALLTDQPDVTVAGVGQQLRAGTNCGSCKSEIANLLKKHTPDIAHAA